MLEILIKKGNIKSITQQGEELIEGLDYEIKDISLASGRLD